MPTTAKTTAKANGKVAEKLAEVKVEPVVATEVAEVEVAEVAVAEVAEVKPAKTAKARDQEAITFAAAAREITGLKSTIPTWDARNFLDSFTVTRAKTKVTVTRIAPLAEGALAEATFSVTELIALAKDGTLADEKRKVLRGEMLGLIAGLKLWGPRPFAAKVLVAAAA